MNLGNTLISKLDNVLLNPSASAPPPNWLDADCPHGGYRRFENYQ